MTPKNMFIFGVCLILLLIGYMSVNKEIPSINSIPKLSGTSLFLHNDTANTSFPSKEMTSTFNISVPLGYINYTSLPSGNTLIQNWTSNQLNFNLIPGGVQGVHIHSLRYGGSGSYVIRLFYRFGTVNSTGENYKIYGTSELSPEVLTTIPYIEADMHLLMPDIHTNLTDRIVISIYANQVGSGILPPNLQLTFDDQTDARFTFPIGI